jgi:aromatic ring-cleaving dioxygenase
MGETREQALADMIKRPSNIHGRYHAHVYFDERTADQAQALCNKAGELFGVAVGRFHRKLVGPHPCWSCQLSFDAAQFPALIDWLDENRAGLDILVHGLTGDALEEHTVHAAWLGNPAVLNLDVFRG